jgi:hypothetical protein
MRATLDWQLKNEVLVCPQTKVPLRREGNLLRGSWHTYQLAGNVPLLLIDPFSAATYAADSEKMTTEYKGGGLRNIVLSFLRSNDFRTQKSVAARSRVLATNDPLCLDLGGGPTRVHDKLVTVNIGPFPEVDVVADAHVLPYADNTVGAVHCEAVFEHLANPASAAREMFRVMKPGALTYVCTPFLQTYHGYPHHYQNFTITGHCRLMTDAGFEIEEKGVCVGPTMTLLQMAHAYGRAYLPFKAASSALYLLARVTIGHLDAIFNARENAYVMACTTYLVARKPH